MKIIKVFVLQELAREKERIVSALITTFIEANLRRHFNTKALGAAAIATALSDVCTAFDVGTIYLTIEKEIEKIIADQNYTEALKVYNNKGLRYRIAHHFGVAGKF